MHIVCGKKTLSHAVGAVVRAAAKSTTLPIATHMRLSMDGDNLRLLTTDLEIWLDVTLPVYAPPGMDDPSEFGLCVPATRLMEVLSGFSGEDVTIRQDGDARRIRLTCGGAEYKIGTLDGEDFPGAPDVTATSRFVVAGSDLRGAISRAEFAVAKDETRSILKGVLFEAEGKKLTVSATDTHLLPTGTIALAEASASASAIVPVRALREISKLVSGEDSVVVTISPGLARFEILPRESAVLAGIALTTRLIEGTYPNYKRVIPTGYSTQWLCKRADVLMVAKRSGIVAGDNAGRVVAASSGDSLNFSASAGSGDYFSESIEVGVSGPDISIAMNYRFLIDALSEMGTDGVAFELTEPLRPVIARPVGDNAPDYLCVLMPMQATGGA